MLDYWLAWLEVKQGYQVKLGALFLPGKLLYLLLSLPGAVGPQLLELQYYTDHFGKVSFFLAWSGLARLHLQLQDGQAW